ncbi:MAG: YtxH domain-containing protein [bacterium]
MSKKNNSISFGLGLFAGVIGGIIAGVLYAPKPGEESRNELKEVVSDLAEKHSPEVKEAKKQALESIDLVKYKMERQYRKLNYMLKSKKLQKAKELEDTEYDFN